MIENMTFEKLDWADVNTLEGKINGAIAILDTNIVLGCGLPARRNSNTYGTVNSEAIQIAACLAEKGTHYAVIIPDFVMMQASKVLQHVGSTEKLEAWQETIKSNKAVQAYQLITPVGSGKETFEEFETNLPKNWKEVTNPIALNNYDRSLYQTAKTDRQLIYTALQVKTSLPNNLVLLVSDDRAHINQGQILTKFNNFFRRYKVKLEVVKSSEFNKLLGN